MMFITILLFTLYAGLLIYYRFGWLQMKPTSSAQQTGNPKLHTTISVIISARNEEENIAECLRSVAGQTYPAHLYEVIVVDDFSSDDTAAIVTSFDKQNISLVSLKDFTGEQVINSYKKKAIEIGISKAKGELVVITDADCIVPSAWLTTLAEAYESINPVFIAAPVAFYQEDSFFKIFQSLDFMTLQGITGASVYKKFHSMCNGANLAYSRKVFYEVEGFKGIDDIASGDDMLLMHKIYKKYPSKVVYLKSVNAIVETKPVKTLKDFFHQRIRWASKADKYSDTKITVVLLMVYFFNVYVLILGIASFFNNYLFYLFVGLMLGKIISNYHSYTPLQNFLASSNCYGGFHWRSLCILYTLL